MDAVSFRLMRSALCVSAVIRRLNSLVAVATWGIWTHCAYRFKIMAHNSSNTVYICQISRKVSILLASPRAVGPEVSSIGSVRCKMYGCVCVC